jgi:hypothetical protein
LNSHGHDTLIDMINVKLPWDFFFANQKSTAMRLDSSSLSSVICCSTTR